MIRRPPRSPLFPYAPLFRSVHAGGNPGPDPQQPAPPPAPPRRLAPAARAEAEGQAVQGVRDRLLPPRHRRAAHRRGQGVPVRRRRPDLQAGGRPPVPESDEAGRSEEHTSELQSRQYLVCRLLLEKKKNYTTVTK